MKRILFILLGLLPLLGWAQPKSTAPLSPAESKARLQQLGDSLRKYDYFENFDRFGWSVVGIRSDKNAKNRFPDRYGIINDYGQVILPCEFSDIRFQEHSDLIMVIKGEKAGFMNRQLKWVIPPKYNGEFWTVFEGYDYFEDGLTVAADADWNYGVVDSTGREIVPCRYKEVNIVGPDFFVVEDDHYGAIDRNGDTVIPFVYKSLRPLYASDGRYFEVKNQDKYGVISNTGQEIIPCIYERVGDSKKGYFALKQAGKWGVMDSVGRIILPFENDVLYLDLLDGADMIGMRTKDGRIRLIGKKWEATFNPSNDYLISKSGEYVAVINYENYEGEGCMIYDRNGKIVDTFEKFVRDETDFVDDGITMIPVKRNGKWGFVNPDFQLIVPCQYDAPVTGFRGYGNVKTSDGLTTLIDEQGQQFVSGPYRFISSPTVNGWFMAGGYPPDSWIGITGFIDRYGNTTFTEEEMQQIEQWHNEEQRSRR